MPTANEWLDFLKPYCRLPHFTIREIAVLLILHNQEKYGFNEIPRIIQIPAPSACRAVDRLCNQGFAKRKRSEADARRVNIYITEKGSEFARGFLK